MTSRFMVAVVCDDIRPEVGNKVSFMGIYGQELVVPSFPATLPKLCAAVYVRTLTSDPFRRLTVRVQKDDTELGQIEIPQAQLEALQSQIKDSIEEGYISAAFMCQFSPVTLEQPCALRFRAETERETLKGGSVRVKAQELDTSPSSSR